MINCYIESHVVDVEQRKSNNDLNVFNKDSNNYLYGTQSGNIIKISQNIPLTFIQNLSILGLRKYHIQTKCIPN